MLVLKRKEGQWLNFTMDLEKHPELAELLMRLRVQNIRFNPKNGIGEVDLVIDDDERHFDIQRPERFTNRQPAQTYVQQALTQVPQKALTQQEA